MLFIFSSLFWSKTATKTIPKSHLVFFNIEIYIKYDHNILILNITFSIIAMHCGVAVNRLFLIHYDNFKTTSLYVYWYIIFRHNSFQKSIEIVPYCIPSCHCIHFDILHQHQGMFCYLYRCSQMLTV